MTKWDKIIILILLAISMLPYMLLLPIKDEVNQIVYAVVSVEGEHYMQIPLTGQVIPKRYNVETEQGKNKIVVENESIAIYDADCPDQVCKQTGFICKAHEMIVCLPHKVLIEIHGQDENQEIDLRSY